MKSKFLAMSLVVSLCFAGSAYAANHNASYQGPGYSSTQLELPRGWDNPPDMDPNFVGVVVPLGRIFATWIARNHKTTWPIIVGLLGYPKAIDDSTPDGDEPEPPESYTDDEEDACKVHHEFNSASDDDQNSGLNEGYGDEYDLSEEEMSQISWFCGNYNAP